MGLNMCNHVLSSFSSIPISTFSKLICLVVFFRFNSNIMSSERHSITILWPYILKRGRRRTIKGKKNFQEKLNYPMYIYIYRISYIYIYIGLTRSWSKQRRSGHGVSFLIATINREFVYKSVYTQFPLIPP